MGSKFDLDHSFKVAPLLIGHYVNNPIGGNETQQKDRDNHHVLKLERFFFIFLERCLEKGLQIQESGKQEEIIK